MRIDLDHLPQKKQRELTRVVEILFAEFEDAVKLATSPRKKAGRILKIVLFGSYARGGWVDEPHTSKGYQSDYDILVIVNDRDLTDVASYWYKAEDRLLREASITTPVNFIVHSFDEVSNALSQGQYFFSDIRREGIVLYELPGHPLLEPKLLTADAAYEAAGEQFGRWSESAREFYDDFRRNLELGRFNKASFELHQAVERFYHCVLLVLTNYSPATHNVKFLRSLAESRDARLIEGWPRESKFERRCFELLKRAYVEARYSEHYKITSEELAWLGQRVDVLQTLVEKVCAERLEELRRNAS